MSFSFLFIILFFCASFSYGQDEKNEREETPRAEVASQKVRLVKWYFPEIQPIKKSKLVKVMISGTAEANAKIYVSSPRIPVIRKDKVLKFSRKKAFISKTQRIAKADKDGLFIYSIYLPEGQIRLPLTVRYADRVKQNFQLNLTVNKDEVKLTNQKDLTRSPAFTKRHEVWGGVGFNYLSYGQNSTDAGYDLIFETFKTPSFFLEARTKLWKNWSLLYTFKMSPGEVQSGGNITISQGSYDWTTHTLETLWAPEKWKMKLFSNRGQWFLRFGFQHHTVPFLAQKSVSGSFDIKTNSITMASAGGHYQEMLNARWDFEFYMRLQYPFASGSTFDLDSSTAFDGSIGLIYNFKNGLRLGTFWYGQMQENKFSSVDAAVAVTAKGEQSLFYSNVDLRVGYAFD